MPEKYLFHNEMTHFLLLDKIILLLSCKKTLKHAGMVREALEGNLKENKAWR